MNPDQDLPMFLWTEAYNTLVYIQNRCFHRNLEDKTLEEAFTSVKQEVIHFRIFGYPVYIHVLAKMRTKLEPSNRKGLFLGYNETSNAYIIYILEQRKIVVSRDVKFEKDLASRKSREPIPMTNDEDLEVQKVELGSLVTSKAKKKPSVEEEETIALSTSFTRPQWFT
jgi:hypothetical protein